MMMMMQKSNEGNKLLAALNQEDKLFIEKIEVKNKGNTTNYVAKIY